MIDGAGKDKGVTLKAVVYGGSGEVKNPRFDLTPKPGKHFVGVKLGLRNFGTKPFTGNPSLTASVASDNGAVSKALDTGKRGFKEVTLKPSQFVLGRLFFEVPDNTRLRSFTFKPFGTASKPMVFEISHGKSADTTKSTKPLPAGGTRKILRGTQAGAVIAAVVYGSSGEVPDSKLTAKPHAGNHFIAVKVGLKNMGKRLFSIDPEISAAITNDKGKLSRAIKGNGLGQVDLEQNETAYGRIFFELPTTRRSARSASGRSGRRASPRSFRSRTETASRPPSSRRSRYRTEARARSPKAAGRRSRQWSTAAPAASIPTSSRSSRARDTTSSRSSSG